MIYSRRFWLDLFERVLSTAAQAAIGALAMTAIVQSVDWQIVAGTAGLAALVSFLKGLAASQKGDPNSASLVE